MKNKQWLFPLLAFGLAAGLTQRLVREGGAVHPRYGSLDRLLPIIKISNAPTSHFESMKQTQLIKSIRRLDEYSEWKKAVHIRDRFTCQHCGARNGRKRVIEADHIEPLADLVKTNQITTLELALNCPPLWDTDNGRTLCHNCHEQTDSYPKHLIKRKPFVTRRKRA